MKKRKIIIFSLCIIMLVTVFSLTSCNNGDKYEIPYDTVDCREGKIDLTNGYILGNIDVNYLLYDTFSVTSVEQIEELGLGGDYSQTFFETKALLLAIVTHPSSEKNISFNCVVLKNNALYPVFEMDCSIGGATGDMVKNLFAIEIDKGILDKNEIGEVLVINRSDLTAGSVYHESVYTYFND